MIKPKCIKETWIGTRILYLDKPHFYKENGKWRFAYEGYRSWGMPAEVLILCHAHVKKLNAKEAQNVIIETITN